MESTLLILAAGMGSRYGGLKQMEPLGPGGEVLLDYSMYDASAAGFSRVVFVIRREIERDFRALVGRRFEARLPVVYVNQEIADVPAEFAIPEPLARTKPWGTGHAIWAAREAVTTPFVAINADDFYGRDAFRLAQAFLGSPNQAAQFAMAGFRLRNTLSPHGSVSRGVCRMDASGRLTKVEELTDIVQTADGISDRSNHDAPRPLTGDELVSMNFWAFTPAVFPLLEQQFRAFLAVSAGSAKAEFYIPFAVSEMIAARQASVDVLETRGQWFGVTYPADKALVMDALRRLIAAGEYPEKLWS